MLNYYVSVLEVIAFCAGFLSLRMKQSVFHWIFFILLITVVNELWIVPAYAVKGGPSSSLFYNIFSLVDMAVWFVVFYKILPGRRSRLYLFFCATLCFLYSALELFYLKSWQVLHTDSERAYNISIIGATFIYFYSKLKEVYHNLLTDSLFWICAACFFYHSIMFVNLTTQGRAEYWKIKHAEVFFYILHDTGNTFYYLLLTFSFVVCYFSYSNKAPT